ncbi:MAG: precorrin-8X methylmutase, partial [Pseudomonadota bacterium]
LWAFLAEHLEDDETNANNRFALADRLNAEAFAGAPKFWGKPPSRDDLKALPIKKHVSYSDIAERRVAERFFKGTQPVWKMFTAGSVGGQTMTGIARLEALRKDEALCSYLRIWPFETDFERSLPQGASVVIAELYPSAFDIAPEADEVLDRAQVRCVAEELARRDQIGELLPLLQAPLGVSDGDRQAMVDDEGSIIGAGVL